MFARRAKVPACVSAREQYCRLANKLLLRKLLPGQQTLRREEGEAANLSIKALDTFHTKKYACELSKGVIIPAAASYNLACQKSLPALFLEPEAIILQSSFFAAQGWNKLYESKQLYKN
jgi:hypothetical protein